MLVSHPDIVSILKTHRTIAMVGLSPKESRPSHRVASYLQAAGYTIIPVNPGQSRILDMPCYPSLLSIPVPVGLVNIFRRSQEVPPIVEEAIAIGSKVIWMQQGIVHEEAAARARQAGLVVIMDRCLMADHANLLGAGCSASLDRNGSL